MDFQKWKFLHHKTLFVLVELQNMKTLEEKYQEIDEKAFEHVAKSKLPPKDTDRLINAYLNACYANVELTERNRKKTDDEYNKKCFIVFSLILLVVFLSIALAKLL